MNSVGYMAGSLPIGFLYDREHHLKLLGILSILNGVTSCVLPWCKMYGLFMLVRLIDGFLCGGRDGGGNAKVAACWKTGGGKYMQALHFTYAFGGIISPIVTNVFLAPRITIPVQQINGSIDNKTFITTTINILTNTTSNTLYAYKQHSDLIGWANITVNNSTLRILKQDKSFMEKLKFILHLS
ncbi:hypothetical protein ACF0H5_009332 [Mactra antiquata]